MMPDACDGCAKQQYAPAGLDNAPVVQRAAGIRPNLEIHCRVFLLQAVKHELQRFDLARLLAFGLRDQESIEAGRFGQPRQGCRFEIGIDEQACASLSEPPVALA